jgi:hypothetical protein
VVQTIKQSRPNLGRILERKAKLVEFELESKYIKVHIPAGGLRDPKEILTDFISEITKLSGEKWVVELPLATQIDMSLQTLHQQDIQAKEDIIEQVKSNSIIKKILNDLVEAEIVDIIEK